MNVKEISEKMRYSGTSDSGTSDSELCNEQAHYLYLVTPSMENLLLNVNS